jgi:hypothetical protein
MRSRSSEAARRNDAGEPMRYGIGTESDLEGFQNRKQKLGLMGDRLGQLVPYTLP